MIIIWGSRWYGKHDEVERQYAVTRFAHLWFIPLVPTRAMWITEPGGTPRGHDMSMSLRGVAHGYARGLGAAVAAIALLAALAESSAVAIGIAIGAVALAGFSLARRKLRGERNRRRAQYGLATIGTACDPLAMPRENAELCRPLAEKRWARAAGNLTPDDVARLGAASPEQAAAAFTLLRIAARVERGPKARAARAASEKILNVATDLKLSGAPYRADLPAGSDDESADPGAAPAAAQPPA